ncbi:ricin-type beta-trefoil lectin domain protein [Pseudoduganella sp. LjRoot289]|uniref:ricin-type beta-trefoil lectin domain protein n=1 Tax=Pseudoduganella sp. LjRoot289 TaxID=3342314 RepID=UPI003ECF86EA
MIASSLATAVALAVFSGEATAAPGVAASAPQINVPPPVLGWASWNAFASSINFEILKAQVDAYAAPGGLKDAGYTYFNLDDGWWQGARDAAGNMLVNETEWPGGMKAVADYIHSKGLKAGIYTDAGASGCGYLNTTRPQSDGMTAGMRGHELQDAKQFQNWGFDFVKVDWCGGGGFGYQKTTLDAQAAYTTISEAIAQASAATGRAMTLSMCQWGRNEPWNWAPGLAPMWRSSDDVIFWEKPAGTPRGAAVALDRMTLKPALSKTLVNFDKGLHPAAHHTGFVNDLDMMIVGNGVARGAGSVDLTEAESRTHMALWVIAGSPLLLGNDLTTMNEATKAIVTNAEVLAINQDGRGLQGVKVAEDSAGLQVYSKVLSGNGKRAVLLLNRTGQSASMTVRWADTGLAAATATVRDVWAKANLGSFAASYTATVPAMASVLLRVGGREGDTRVYEAEASANTLGGNAARVACAKCSNTSKVARVGNGATLVIKNVKAATAGLKLANIVYSNGESHARRASLQVNGQTPTVVSFPSTGGRDKIGSVSVMLSLAKGTANTITFSNASGQAPDFDAVVIQDIAGTNGGTLVSAPSGRCVDLPNNNASVGIEAGLGDCHGGQNQTFARTARSELLVYGNRCLDALGATAIVGAKIGLGECNGSNKQQWEFAANGTMTMNGLCLDVPANGHPELAACNANSRTQQWQFSQ